MNVYDSQVAAGLLEQAGFEVVSEGEELGELSLASWKPLLSRGADIVLMNTCSVREHAEDRVWGRLGMLSEEKRQNPKLVIGLMGCMVEEHREKLFKRFPQLDLMIGTRHIKELPELIKQVLEKRKQVARIKQDGLSIEYSEWTQRETGFHAWLPIMTGCDKVCTFCIVPKTRGHEVSMPAEEVYREACRLVEDGVKWITLLGQNVNSYNGGAATFPQLLERLCGIEKLERLSFTTSHPCDATEDLFQTMARNPKIGKRFHLPLQSGSDRILRRMKRLHTFADYQAKIDRLRVLIPDIAITTDIIVGFPGETEEDYEATKRTLETVRFDGAFIYKYSARPGTPAAHLVDDVPEAVKVVRNNELLGIQRKITEQINEGLLGKELLVFVEAVSPRNSEERIGRTDQDKRVYFESPATPCGKFVRVRLTELRHETFRGIAI